MLLNNYHIYAKDLLAVDSHKPHRPPQDFIKRRSYPLSISPLQHVVGHSRADCVVGSGGNIQSTLFAAPTRALVTFKFVVLSLIGHSLSLQATSIVTPKGDVTVLAIQQNHSSVEDLAITSRGSRPDGRSPNQSKTDRQMHRHSIIRGLH